LVPHGTLERGDLGLIGALVLRKAGFARGSAYPDNDYQAHYYSQEHAHERPINWRVETKVREFVFHN